MLVEFLPIFVANTKVFLGYNSVASSKAYSLINARDILKIVCKKAPSNIFDRVLHTSLSSNELEKLIFLKDTLKALDDFKNKQEEKKLGLFFDM